MKHKYLLMNEHLFNIANKTLNATTYLSKNIPENTPSHIKELIQYMRTTPVNKLRASDLPKEILDELILKGFEESLSICSLILAIVDNKNLRTTCMEDMLLLYDSIVAEIEVEGTFYEDRVFPFSRYCLLWKKANSGKRPLTS